MEAGRYHSCALTVEGALYTWGCGENGQLGHDSDENVLFPRLVESILGCVIGQVSCGDHHTALLAASPYTRVSNDVLAWFHRERYEYEFKHKVSAHSLQRCVRNR